MKIESKAVHAGDRKRTGGGIPVATPIFAASSFFFDSAETIDKVFSHEIPGYAYSRYDNPTNAALEEQITALEGGRGTLATASGMAALQIAVTSALLDRRKSVLAANMLYGATTNLLMNVMEPFGTAVNFVDMCDLKAVAEAIEREKPGCLVLESISNPLLRVSPIDEIAKLAQSAGAALIVDNTFATPLLLRPIELGATMSVNSSTKYLAGHGDLMGGLVTCDESSYETVRSLSRTYGPIQGPFEAYLTMRGVKTFPLRVERQNQNARAVAEWLLKHPRVANVNFPGLAEHPDRATIDRLFPAGLYGAMLSFEIRDAERADMFRFMDALKMIVPATSLGDVHSMVLYPVIASHRDLSPKQRARLGIHDNLMRISVGIEAIEDILSDLDQALA